MLPMINVKPPIDTLRHVHPTCAPRYATRGLLITPLTSKCMPLLRANKTSRPPPKEPTITACLGIARWDRSSTMGGFSEAIPKAKMKWALAPWLPSEHRGVPAAFFDFPVPPPLLSFHLVTLTFAKRQACYHEVLHATAGHHLLPLPCVSILWSVSVALV